MFNNVIIKMGASPWNPRGKYRFFKILARVLGSVQGVTPEGVKLRFKIDDFTGYYYFKKDYQQDLYGLIRGIGSGGVFVDVGANMGNYSIFAARELGANGMVVSFEPVSDTYQSLIQHVKLNRSKNIISWNAAVGERAGLVEMSSGDDSGLNHIVSSTASTNRSSILTPLVVLDDVLPALLAGRSIDFMKIDVEGAELGVLMGARKLLAAKLIKKISVEVCPEYLARFGVTIDDLMSFMHSFGYRSLIKATGVAVYDEIFEC